MPRERKTPTPAEVEQEIADLLDSWGEEAYQLIHEGHKQYDAAIRKKSRGLSPLTANDLFILQDLSAKVKYDHYKKYKTLKTKLKKAQEEHNKSKPVVLESSRDEVTQSKSSQMITVGSSRRELEQRDMGPKKSTMKELVPISRRSRSFSVREDTERGVRDDMREIIRG
eukprot:CAMPEP_0181128510 /NCGR_PEP_ID=MMETSP1071-20121207/28806_1 /TAXON_ID=35127 /ORGANISM="Thalassiosira sp., Strain NH16" /LENGTH=168 /DNA_ID=CAMNT_0023214393 /DNA_START=331 /DNA_END=834 /DNA_ORIENTATION=-